MDVEVLVHFKASSKFSDDKKHLAVSQGVLDFKPVKRIAVTHSPDGRNSTTSILCDSEVIQYQSEASVLEIGRVQDSYKSASKVNEVRDGCRVTKVSTPPQIRGRVITPCHQIRQCESVVEVVTSGRETMLASKSDLIARIGQAAQVLVSNTTHSKRKRRWFGSISSDSDCLVTHNTRSLLPIDQFAETQHSEQMTASQASKKLIETEHVEHISNWQPHDFRAIRTDPSNYNGIVKKFKQQTTLVERDPPSASYKSQKPLSQSSFLLEHVESGAQDAETENGTATLSTTLSGGHSYTNCIHCKEFAREDGERQAPIDLTSPKALVLDKDMAHTQIGPMFTAIQTLPLVISAPDPYVNQFSVATYNTSLLKASADKLSFPQRFQPQEMTRPVSDRERGYWNVSVDVVVRSNASRVEPTHCGLKDQDRNKKISCLAKHEEVDEADFLAMWADLHQFVSTGNAGWGVRVVRRNFTIVKGEKEVGHRAKVYVQVYCYGEAIPYVYAMLIVCTRMYIANKQTQWISAIDQNPIVIMPTHKAYPTLRGRWSHLVNERGGSWFMSKLEE